MHEARWVTVEDRRYPSTDVGGVAELGAWKRGSCGRLVELGAAMAPRTRHSRRLRRVRRDGGWPRRALLPGARARGSADRGAVRPAPDRAARRAARAPPRRLAGRRLVGVTPARWRDR